MIVKMIPDLDDNLTNHGFGMSGFCHSGFKATGVLEIPKHLYKIEVIDK